MHHMRRQTFYLHITFNFFSYILQNNGVFTLRPFLGYFGHMHVVQTGIIRNNLSFEVSAGSVPETAAGQQIRWGLTEFAYR